MSLHEVALRYVNNQLFTFLNNLLLNYRMHTDFHGTYISAQNNFHDFNFVNGGLQQQTCTVCMHILAFLFSRMPIVSRNSRKFVHIQYLRNH